MDGGQFLFAGLQSCNVESAKNQLLHRPSVLLNTQASPYRARESFPGFLFVLALAGKQ